MDFDALLIKAQELVIEYVPSVVSAVLLLIVGLFIINRIVHVLDKALQKAKIDATLKPFFLSLTSASLKILLLIIVLTQLGAQLSSFVAIIGASSLAIGLAFQGVLSNFAGGVLLLSLRPFKVGDYISANGQEGTVESIQIFNTIIVTVDNRVITVPNGTLANTSIVNFTSKPTRRVELVFSVGYEQDIDIVKAILTTIATAHKLVLIEPAPFVKLKAHGDNAIHFVVRVWTLTSDYWDVYFDILESVKKEFDIQNISIPYPQLDVHFDRGHSTENK